MKESSGRLNSKVAIVTGATSGIGEAIARLFAHEHAKVVVAGRRVEAGEKIVRDIRQAGAEAIFVQTDMVHDEQIRNLVDRTVEKYGTVDILVNNAGTLCEKPFLEVTHEDWDRVVALDGRSYFVAMQTVLPYMEKQHSGAILNVTSVAAVKLNPVLNIYTFCKAGITQMSSAIALEYAAKGIRVNSLLPGVTLTEMTQGAQRLDEVAKFLPMGRLSTAEEQAYPALFLVSDEASYITGTSLIVSGGFQ